MAVCCAWPRWRVRYGRAVRPCGKTKSFSTCKSALWQTIRQPRSFGQTMTSCGHQRDESAAGHQKDDTGGHQRDDTGSWISQQRIVSLVQCQPGTAARMRRARSFSLPFSDTAGV